LLLKAKDKWSGTLILCFQPAEEKGAGAQAMVDDGLYDKVPLPDIVLGGHVMPFKAGKTLFICSACKPYCDTC
jgi:metal-dependent amidase/aminoacylase/carboxypeptidase family protein